MSTSQNNLNAPNDKAKMVMRGISEDGEWNKMKIVLRYFPTLVYEDISYDKTGKTALHHIAWLADDNEQSLECVNILAKYEGFDANIVDDYGQTALDIAVSTDNIKIAKAIKKLGGIHKSTFNIS